MTNILIFQKIIYSRVLLNWQIYSKAILKSRRNQLLIFIKQFFILAELLLTKASEAHLTFTVNHLKNFTGFNSF